ncbi:hypothetical protein ACKVWC_001080 [Pyricularia oryzae]
MNRTSWRLELLGVTIPFHSVTQGQLSLLLSELFNFEFGSRMDPKTEASSCSHHSTHTEESTAGRTSNPTTASHMHSRIPSQPTIPNKAGVKRSEETYPNSSKAW